MQSSQVPAWLAVVVAFIAFTGVVTGQFINAWRESKKSKREESYKTEAHWRDVKLALYLDVIDNFGKHIDSAHAVMNEHRSKKEAAASVREGMEISDTVARFMSRMRLLAPPEVFKSFKDTGRMTSSLFIAALEAYRDEGWESSAWADLESTTQRQLEAFADAVRKDLKMPHSLIRRE